MKSTLSLIAFLFCTIVSSLSAQFETEKESYVGNIDKYAIVLDLEYTPDGQGGVLYSGSYYYESQGEDKRIKLDGHAAEYGAVMLYERDASGKISATFELTAPEYGELDGTWTSTKGKVYAVYLQYADLPMDDDDDDSDDE